MSDLLLLRYTQHKNYLNYAEKETGKQQQQQQQEKDDETRKEKQIKVK